MAPIIKCLKKRKFKWSHKGRYKTVLALENKYYWSQLKHDENNFIQCHFTC